jgi:AraC-like DNA-binding protein
MSASGIAVFTNPDDYLAGISETNFNLVLTGPGDFKARLTWLKLDHLQIFRGRENLARVAYMSLEPTRIFVSFPLSSTSPLAWNGIELQLGSMVLHARGEHGHQWTKGASRWALISLPGEELTYYCKALAELNLGDLPAGRILRPRPSAATQLRRLHSKGCNLAETKPEIFAYREAARAFEQEFIHALVNCLTPGATSSHRRIQQHDADIMTRFEDALGVNFGKQPRSSELCATIGVPERTLRECCVKFLGLTPARYIWLRRLNLVRAELRRAAPATESVAQIALRYHFSEPGRFAADYRTLFGEPPSVTLKKA